MQHVAKQIGKAGDKICQDALSIFERFWIFLDQAQHSEHRCFCCPVSRSPAVSGFQARGGVKKKALLVPLRLDLSQSQKQ